MGGHGGLNILPQKRWNVYNFDNREKVRLDEETAAKEEQLKREQSRRRDTELRLEKLRQARGLATRDPSEAEDKPSSTSVEAVPAPAAALSVSNPLNSESDSKHINLFEGIRIFDPIKPGDEKRSEKRSRFARDEDMNKRIKKEEVRVVGPEDEKYKLGYGVAGKGVRLPWYMEKRVVDGIDDNEEHINLRRKEKKTSGGGKKTMDELRKERLKREMKEKERERALLMMKHKKDGGFSSS
ncbi:inner centromere protein-like [Salvia divinorum]|uniref:Inner centromere protein-like n=1 Tax=Salvia divinorum TaxID=28513 RepID=A0ABD1HUQ8_SALDI